MRQAKRNILHTNDVPAGRYATSRLIASKLDRQIKTALGSKNDRDKKRWLYLVSSATGSGKSHAVASIMAHYASNASNARFIYIIHLLT